MKISNVHNLPSALIKAIEDTSMPPEDGWRVSEIINPFRLTILQRRHWNEIEEDASERIWVLLGNAVHYILEKGAHNALSEERLSATIDNIKVYGRPDLFDSEGNLYDYKVTSVWTVIYEPQGRREWEKQLNLYRWLYYQNGFEAQSLKIVTILRDWQRSQVNSPNYPSLPVVMINVPKWNLELTQQYLQERVSLLEKFKNIPDDRLPVCLPDEQWRKETTYAIIKEGQKKAVKICQSRDEAEKILVDMGRGYTIEERLGENTRCLYYCPVRNFCNVLYNL